MNRELITKYILNEFKISQSNNGYRYITYAIYLIQQNPGALDHITKTLYIDIANNFSTTILCVERSVRTTIETIWRHQNYNLQLFFKIFGTNYQHRPTNTEFFKLLHEYIDTVDNAKCRLEGISLACRSCIFVQKYLSELGKLLDD